ACIRVEARTPSQARMSTRRSKEGVFMLLLFVVVNQPADGAIVAVFGVTVQCEATRCWPRVRTPDNGHQVITMIPRTLFGADHELFRGSVEKFLEQHAVPFHAQWEKDGHVDRGLWRKAGEAGLLCSHLPEAYGGMEADFLYSAVVIEEIARLGLSGIGFSLHSDIVAPYLLRYGSEAQKQRYLPRMVSGELIG